LGNAYRYLGQHQDAIAPLTKATKLDPTNVEYFHNLGCAYLKLGQYKSAIEPIFKEVYFSKELSKIIFVKKLIYSASTNSEKQKIIKDLIIPLNKALIKNGMAAETAKMNMADALVTYTELTLVGAKRPIEKAIELYFEINTERAIKKACSLAKEDRFIRKEKADILYQIGNQYALKGLYTEALANYQESIKLNQEFLDVYVQANIVCTEIGEVDQAKEYHIAASRFFKSAKQGLTESILVFDSGLKDMLPIIEGYLFDPSQTEMSGTDSMMDALSGL